MIRHGDALHADVGITWLHLNTDTQKMGYVLRIGEDDVPQGLKKALALGTRWQDLLTSNFVTGRSGNHILAATLEAMKREKIMARPR